MPLPTRSATCPSSWPRRRRWQVGMREANDDEELERRFVAARTEAANALWQHEVHLESSFAVRVMSRFRSSPIRHGNAMHLCERD